MGACHETNADRTKFIINEDFKIKQALLRTMQSYTTTNYQQQPRPEEMYYEKRNLNYYYQKKKSTT